MKVNGVEVRGGSEDYLVLPRPGGTDIVFHAVAVVDMDEFDTRCPTPRPTGRRLTPGGGWQDNIDDPSYQEALEKHGMLRFAYILLKSLEPSGIEWDTVDPAVPSSWLNWRDDLVKAEFNTTEINRIVNVVSSANSLNEAKLEEARESFLRGLAKASNESSGLDTELPITQSGEAAND